MEESLSEFSILNTENPLIFTIVPLRDSKTGDREHDERILRNLESKAVEITNSVDRIKRLNAINVPELVEENHEGRPRYNSIYTEALAKRTAELLKIVPIVNKVVVHIDSYEKLVNWVKETSNQGINNMIFVGGNTRHHRYPGPTVSEANLIARRLWEKSRGVPLTIGNISLPERSDEAKRMLFKTISGAQFFTTQMLFSSEGIVPLMGEYGRLCKIADVKPATVIFSFAPLRSVSDLNLLDFLGVDLPENKKIDILEGRDIHKASRRSIYNSIRVFGEIKREMEKREIQVPIGVNVEQLTKSNLPSSVEMLKEFSKVIDLSGQEILDYSETLE